jgi:rhamnosyltransferase
MGNPLASINRRAHVLLKTTQNAIDYLRQELLRNRTRDEREARVFSVLLDGRDKLTPRRPLCMFAHFDSAGKLSESVLEYLSALAGCDFQIIFVSTSPVLETADVSRIAPLCSVILKRPNIGHDFFSWKTACDFYPGWRRHPYMVWTNDSVFARPALFPAMIDHMVTMGAEVVGATDCHVYEYHLQSYFLLFKQHVLEGDELSDFLAGMRVHRHKRTLVKAYEIGLSRALKSDYKLGAWIETAQLRTRGNEPIEEINPTIDCWAELIADYRYPFLKKELVSKRGLSLQSAGTLFQRLESPEDTANG